MVSSGAVLRDHSFAGSTTYKLGGPAAWYANVATRAELEAVLEARLGERDVPPVFILGRGSNIVVSDAGYRGLIIHLAGEFTSVALQDDVVTAGAAVALPQLARFCAAEGRGGLEFYVGIPGSVGGAVVMNAGGHGSDTAEWLTDATILDSDTGATSIEDPAALDLSYRHSRIRSNEIVLSARYRTVERPREEGERLMREITAWRRSHQPGGTFNAGSVFKNPPGDAAGRIIDEAGLKGLRCGAVSVSKRHANFFVAEKGATAQDMHDLVGRVVGIVRDRTGIELRPEIRFVGEFGEAR